jgi:hypothetical protein
MDQNPNKMAQLLVGAGEGCAPPLTQSKKPSRDLCSKRSAVFDKMKAPAIASYYKGIVLKMTLERER